jgi:hypothetical protein
MKAKNPSFDWDNVRVSNWLTDNKVREKVVKIREKIQEKQIEKIAEQKSQIDYSIEDCFNEFEEVRRIALCLNGYIGKIELANALKAIENKAKLKGHYIEDNSQKVPPPIEHPFKIF